MEDELVFRIIRGETELKIYDSGRVEGLLDANDGLRSIIINRFPTILQREVNAATLGKI